MTMIGPEGTAIAENDDSNGETNSRIPDDGTLFVLPSSGTYIIEVSSFSANTTGNYTLNLSDHSCAYSISPDSQVFTSRSGSGSVDVTASTGCGWTAVSNDSFITVTHGSEGIGNGVVTYNVAGNTSSDPRFGTIIIGGQVFTITQEGNSTSCQISCPVDVNVNNTPGQCGAVVNYSPPSIDGSCGTVTCSPASGSFFPVGTTTVTCAISSEQGCTFTVKVNDAQPPSILCPANISETAVIGQTSTVVAFSTTVVDNCSGASVVCSPPSGSAFPLGITTVACIATDTSGNQSNCTFKVAVSGTLLVHTDSFLRSGSGNTNEGANERLRIQSSGNNRTLVKFNLAGISVSGLQSATLVLNIAENSNNWGANGRMVDVHRLLTDWAEGNGRNDVMAGGGSGFRGTGEGVTWECARDSNINNQASDCISEWNGGSFATASASVLHTNNQTGDVIWNVTADLLAGANNGWLIKKQNEGQNGQVRYYSREGAALEGNGNLSPRLVLVYQP